MSRVLVSTPLAWISPTFSETTGTARASAAVGMFEPVTTKVPMTWGLLSSVSFEGARAADAVVASVWADRGIAVPRPKRVASVALSVRNGCIFETGYV
jgi:hypothetical protein